MFYKLGEPQRQKGITGVIIPIQWSDTEEPFDPFRSSSLIVSAVMQNGTLIIDEGELDAQIDQMEDDIIVSRTPIPGNTNVTKRFSKVSPGKKHVEKDKPDNAKV